MKQNIATILKSAPKFSASLAISSLLASTALAAEEYEYDISPLKTIEVNEDKAELGEKLFHDPMLSADGKVSCSSCHGLDKGGDDDAKTSTGIVGQLGPINSPTVFNAAHNFSQFWDGRAATLENQALGPVENPLEMGDTWENVVKKVSADEDYKKAFDALYGGKVTKENIAHAIAEFERTLITPDSRFDQFLAGNKNILTKREKDGWELFKEVGCASCHNGSLLGGNSYQYLSEEYFEDRGGEITEADLGRYNVTKDEGDKHSFKVPTLRNIALTAPYFHDGEVKTLEDAVKKMAKYQLGEELSSSKAKAITAYLKTLTGNYQGKPLR